MKLAIDATNISSGGGMIHLVNLLANVDIDSTAFNKVYIWGSRKTLAKLEARPWLILCSNTRLDGSLVSRTWWKLLHLTREVRAADCDVLFAPGGSYTGAFHPFVTMSRNMLPFEWREMRRFGLSVMFLKLFMLRFIQTQTYRHADGIIFLTEYARREVMKVVGKTNALLEVIPHGINRQFLGLSAKRILRPDALRIIYVSIIDMYKHQWKALEAVSKLRQKGIEASIEFIGPANAKALRKFELARNIHDPERTFTLYRGDVEYSELPSYYEKADICLFASTCENMPNILLEGMAAGLPIACSEKPPMTEILGDAGVYFNAESPEDIARALETLLESVNLRESLAEKSCKIADNFTWPNTAAATFRFLEKVVSVAVRQQ